MNRFESNDGFRNHRSFSVGARSPDGLLHLHHRLRGCQVYSWIASAPCACGVLLLQNQLEIYAMGATASK